MCWLFCKGHFNDIHVIHKNLMLKMMKNRIFIKITVFVIEINMLEKCTSNKIEVKIEQFRKLCNFFFLDDTSLFN